MKLYIKCMVGIHCKMLVHDILEKSGLHSGAIELGEVEILENMTTEQRHLLKFMLVKSGFDLIEDKKAILVEKIKHVIVHMVHFADDLPNTKNSNYLSENLNKDYRYLAKVFSESTGTTIERYIIAQKIERVKEYLLYNEMNLTQISYVLNYCSVAHLSNQFKKLTGVSPSGYKQLGRNKRIPLENL
ncbi:AraC family transcriptional regulator [Dyadobacter sp. CY312]|uniref:helix-turn-helix domain-containing protein n=1 Tax=Dyadobacter sp. CY312 TaxID=2907303 RepID=UPI001F1D74FF|nr:AraC family transcriptional regulator [Dyadobacter sp. CY312]MCE7042810.1 AraC family transcriptional regulator [Dyadobacter sp. CY312]